MLRWTPLIEWLDDLEPETYLYEIRPEAFRALKQPQYDWLFEDFYGSFGHDNTVQAALTHLQTACKHEERWWYDENPIAGTRSRGLCYLCGQPLRASNYPFRVWVEEWRDKLQQERVHE